MQEHIILVGKLRSEAHPDKTDEQIVNHTKRFTNELKVQQNVLK